MTLDQGRIYAEEMRQALLPYCEDSRCVIAGSIRRQCPIVNDIEIVAIPIQSRLTTFYKTAASFASPKTGLNRDSRYIKLVRKEPRIGEVQFDLFIPRPYDWGRILAIRTGSSAFAHKMLASQWVKKDYCGTDFGLLPQEMCVKKGDKWQLKPGVSPETCRVEFPEEIDFFNWLGLLVMPEPRFRNL